MKQIIANFAITGLMILFLSACKVLPSVVRDKYMYVQKNKAGNVKWQLIWKDEFDGSEIDTAKWSKIPAGNSDWNRHMSNNNTCYAVEGGKLFLRGINNTDTVSDSRPYLTGGIYSKGKFAFQYGKIEIHAKLENAQGAWPAMWMLAEQDKYGAYPRNGEIDIMEHLNFDSIIYQTTHSWYTLELKQDNNPPHYSTAKLNMNKYNTYGLKWYPDKLIFTMNGKETFTYPRLNTVDVSEWPYDQPFYIMIDQQLGGNWVGKINTSQLPVQLVVDWVRVYQ